MDFPPQNSNALMGTQIVNNILSKWNSALDSSFMVCDRGHPLEDIESAISMQ